MLEELDDPDPNGREEKHREHHDRADEEEHDGIEPTEACASRVDRFVADDEAEQHHEREDRA